MKILLSWPSCRRCRFSLFHRCVSVRPLFQYRPFCNKGRLHSNLLRTSQQPNRLKQSQLEVIKILNPTLRTSRFTHGHIILRELLQSLLILSALQSGTIPSELFIYNRKNNSKPMCHVQHRVRRGAIRCVSWERRAFSFCITKDDKDCELCDSLRGT